MTKKRKTAQKRPTKKIADARKAAQTPQGRHQLRVYAAGVDFWTYCTLKAPTFYTPDRAYLREICDELQDFAESDDEVLVLNAPPRHGKSRTISLFTSWIFGRKPTLKVMTGSYNEMLSTSFSKSVRDTITEVKASPDRAVFSDVFPGVTIKRGDAAMNLWSLEDGHNNYLATSPMGTATGFGADLEIIDDLIKSSAEAQNSTVLDGHWDWFANTMVTRIEEGGKIIIVMTRWSTKDLAGRVLEWCKKENKKYRHISFKAHQGNGVMLCPAILSYKSYLDKASVMSRETVRANYDQEPMDVRGKLYAPFKTYSSTPVNQHGESLIQDTRSYTDTADEGKDFLCQIIYGTHDGLAYIRDVYYTQEAMETTEAESARRLATNKVRTATIESNNGGRGFARQVKAHLQKLNWAACAIRTFTQRKNKRARILSNATSVNQRVIMPADWEYRWPQFYDAITTYQREGHNPFDDAPDALTGVIEDVLGISDSTSAEGKYSALKTLGI
jgi:predicted phage terminase large subunit-like protein